MSKRVDRAFIVCAVVVAVCLAAVAVITAAARPDAARARFRPDISFPHSGSCAHPDAVTRAPCSAAVDLLLGANSGDPRLYCRAYARRSEYQACVAGVAFSDPGFSEFQTVSFRVRSVRLPLDGVAVVRVHVWPFSDGGPPGDVLLVLQRDQGWYHVVGIERASSAAAS